MDQPAIAIMTPERLAHSLREGADEVLAQYGMFVFDEAHQVREKGRGFLLG
ncbi:MAG: DEAD/DEAH box helicase [Mycobacterium sp.]